MERKKIINLLNSSEKEYSKFATKNVIDRESKGVCSKNNPIKFLRESCYKNYCCCKR